MKRKPSHVVLLAALLLLCVNPAAGQDASEARPKKPRTPADYKPRTLKELAAEGAAAAPGLGNKEETMIVRAGLLPSRVRVTYGGSARPLPRIKKEVVRQWARLYAGAPESYTKPYETELLFKENGTGYWLAVRKESLARFGRELKKGEALDLYLIRMGAAKTPGAWEPVILVESFRKPE